MNLFSKTILATVGTAMLALGTTAPASAQAGPDHRIDWQVRDHGRDQGRGHGRDQGRDHMQPDGKRFAVEQCTRAATDRAGRLGKARVTGIDAVDMTRDGAQVGGQVAVYSRGWNGKSHQRGTFSCRVDHGQVVNIDFHGLRGLRR